MSLIRLMIDTLRKYLRARYHKHQDRQCLLVFIIKDDVDVEAIINNIVLEMFFYVVSRKTPNYTDAVINNIMSQKRSQSLSERKGENNCTKNVVQ